MSLKYSLSVSSFSVVCFFPVRPRLGVLLGDGDVVQGVDGVREELGSVRCLAPRGDVGPEPRDGAHVRLGEAVEWDGKGGVSDAVRVSFSE